MRGEIAQPVEQRPEKPCVPSSILGLATILYPAPISIKIAFISYA